ncbi:hypothetical protein M2390_002928 [Mycetocola sp. BIGb0189]|uniref:hypothetical protein n=1 Tax=Mycetocola sp. BIGb0189 TaxID=2940604 RepID=UPI002169FD43|nr:hypothetical protein [Mycetocola sp. BIGb0189]MCS4277719.1 hypothetical protein [Mycetocola sp. BIGb0189]
MMGIDSSEVRSLSASLGEIPDKSLKKVRQATEVTARKTKDSWKGKLAGGKYLPHLSRAVSYELKGHIGIGGVKLSAEIGVEKGSAQGPLAVFDEFGSINNAGTSNGANSLVENVDDFVKGLEKAMEPDL